jgi:hypothetical protein
VTPPRAIAAIVGAVVSSTMRKRKPSATKRTTLCGRGCAGVLSGACADAADASTIETSIVTRQSSERMARLLCGGKAMLSPQHMTARHMTANP